MKYNDMDRLICTKSYPHPDTGKRFIVKNRRYYTHPLGDDIYEIGTRYGNLICGEKFIDEHFIKEEN